MRRTGCVAGLLLIQAVAAQETHPVEVIKRVEADYSNLATGYVIDTVEVEMTVGPDGAPFAIKTDASLPDNVVTALSAWRYKPIKSKTGGWFGVRLKTPVRRPIDAKVENSLRRTWFPHDADLMKDIAAGDEMDGAKAAGLENRIQQDSNDIASRNTLLAYYGHTGGEPRPRQIAWMVEHQPESEILGGPLALINPAQPDSYKLVKDLWLAALQKNPGSIDIVEHASNFLRTADGAKAEEIVMGAAPSLPKARVWIGDIWALSALGVTALDTRTGEPVLAGTELPKAGYGARARGSLMSVADTRVLISALASVSEGGRALARAGHLPADFTEFCQGFRERVLKAYPGVSYTCDTTTAPTMYKDQVRLSRIRVGGTVAQGNLVKKVVPEYPRDARSRGITGTVHFQVTIGENGKLTALELVGGPLALYPAARAAVSQWEYKPTLVNGKPVEVLTMIDVNFTLGQ